MRRYAPEGAGRNDRTHGDEPSIMPTVPDPEPGTPLGNEIDRLRAALQSIADGNVMRGEWTHAETVAKYQRIARDALAMSRL